VVDSLVLKIAVGDSGPSDETDLSQRAISQRVFCGKRKTLDVMQSVLRKVKLRKANKRLRARSLLASAAKVIVRF
jgi:hypothetical protein